MHTHHVEDVERAQGVFGAGESSATHFETRDQSRKTSPPPKKMLPIEMDQLKKKKRNLRGIFQRRRDAARHNARPGNVGQRHVAARGGGRGDQNQKERESETKRKWGC